MLQEVKTVVDDWTQFSEMDELTSASGDKDEVEVSDAEIKAFAELLANM